MLPDNDLEKIEIPFKLILGLLLVASLIPLGFILVNSWNGYRIESMISQRAKELVQEADSEELLEYMENVRRRSYNKNLPYFLPPFASMEKMGEHRVSFDAVPFCVEGENCLEIHYQATPRGRDGEYLSTENLDQEEMTERACEAAMQGKEDTIYSGAPVFKDGKMIGAICGYVVVD